MQTRLNQLKKISSTLILSLFLSTPMVYSQTLDQQIDAMVAKMSLSEKFQQITWEGFMTTSTNSKLGIPGFLMDDGPHGVRSVSKESGAITSETFTCFPVGIAMMATWDKDLAFRIGKGMGEEFHDASRNVQLGPCIDYSTDPRNGRAAEAGGEDTYLSGQMGLNIIKGVQTSPVIATVKHFMFETIQPGRGSINATATRRDIYEVYGYHFRKAIQEAGSLCIMSSYNKINGVKATDNKMLLDTVLRKSWGFPFFVMSDWWAIGNAADAIKASTDLCMQSYHYANDLPPLVNNNTVAVAYVDSAVRNILRTKYLSGMMDHIPAGNTANLKSANHEQICLDAARKTMILLKNTNNILPLDKAANPTIALIGPSAAIAQTDISGSDLVMPPYAISPRQGIEAKIGASNVAYVKGCDINSTSTSGFAAAINAAKVANYVIFVGGLDGTQEGEEYVMHSDRVGGKVELPGKQQELINQLAAVNPNIIVVINSGGICSIPDCINNIKGLIYAFYPGQEGGNGLADVLFGDYNPAGRLPVTMPVNTAQLPTWDTNFIDGFNYGYRYYDEMNLTPQFAFGFGLSYTTFVYSNITVTPSANLGKNITVTVDVQNTGLRNGEEVVQLYINKNTHNHWAPKKQLKGFTRIALAAGEKKTVTFTLTSDDLYVYDESSRKYLVETGDYQAFVGGSSDNLPLNGQFTIDNTTAKPDLKIANIYSYPKFPKAGEKVIFLATVLNYGTSATTKGNPIKLVFSINGQIVSWNDTFSESIPAGGMKLICVEKGINGSLNWTPAIDADYQLEARIDENNVVDEDYEDNNSATQTLTVKTTSDVITDPNGENIALKKPVTASSEEPNKSTPIENINDGLDGSRWSSEFTDNQWVVVDLQNKYSLNKIDIYWEGAYASQYNILMSDDNVNWTLVKQVKPTAEGHQVTDISATGQYLKIQGIKRATAYGYSIYELKAYGSLATSLSSTNGSLNNIKISPNPVSNTLHVVSATYLPNTFISLYNLEGCMVYEKTMSSAQQDVDVSNLKQGIYTLNIFNSTNSISSKIVKL